MSDILCDTISTTTDDHVSSNESALRRRNPWNSLVADGIDLLADVDELDDEEEEDGAGCPLPSTPEDNQLLEAEVKLIINYNVYCLAILFLIFCYCCCRHYRICHCFCTRMCNYSLIKCDSVTRKKVFFL